MKVATTKPELKMENGVLTVKASVGVDNDEDGKQSVGFKAEVFVDPKEAVTEIFKNGIPDWAAQIFGQHATAEQKQAMAS